MKAPIRVVLADDHELFREGLGSLFAREPAISVVGVASNGFDVITVSRSYRPDVVLLDVEMPGPPANVTIARILRELPQTRVLVLTMHRDAVLRRELLEAGATGYLTKAAPAKDLVAAIESAMTHQPTSPPASGSTGSSQTRGLLSRRELQVLRLMAQARSNRSIAQELSITEGTVKRHANNIYKKLNAVSRMDAVRRGQRLGLFTTG